MASEPKIRRSNEGFRKSNPLPQPSPWNKLPDLVLSRIYSYLSDQDKFNASLVNKHWNRGFATPANWRKRCIVLDGNCRNDKLWCIKIKHHCAFVQKFASHLHILHLSLSAPTLRSNRLTYFNYFSNIITKLIKDSHLHEIHVTGMRAMWKDYINICKILEKFLREQTELQVLNLEGVKTAGNIGISLLVAASESVAARNTIHTLRLVSNTNTVRDTSSAIMSTEVYLGVMGKFKKLQVLHIEWKFVSKKLLSELGKSLGSCFRELGIFCTPVRRGTFNQVEDEAWRELFSTCPNLRILMTIEGPIRNQRWPEAIFKHDMPIVSLDMTKYPLLFFPKNWALPSTIDPVVFWHGQRLVEYVVNKYENVLEYLQVKIHPYQMSVEEITHNFMTKLLCLRKLRTLNVSGEFTPKCITDMYEILDQPLGDNKLEHIQLTAWCKTQKDADTLTTTEKMLQAKRKYKTLQMHFRTHVYENICVYDEYGSDEDCENEDPNNGHRPTSASSQGRSKFAKKRVQQNISSSDEASESD